LDAGGTEKDGIESEKAGEILRPAGSKGTILRATMLIALSRNIYVEDLVSGSEGTGVERFN
jgi:hypothetical protein